MSFQLFKSLVGLELDFYGVENLNFKLGDRVFCAIEDEEDGYRSSLGSIELFGDEKKVAGPFSQVPIAKIRIIEVKNYFEFHDTDIKHLWLKIGTDYSDSYYPLFIFQYSPREPTYFDYQKISGQKFKFILGNENNTVH